MKESYSEGLAIHTGPKSCGATREGGAEALTGERSGRVLSRERSLLRDADTLGGCGRPHWMHRYRKAHRGPARSQTPSTYGNTSHGNREIPGPPAAVVVAGRIGKSKDTRR
jgi:hypothetical protein